MKHSSPCLGSNSTLNLAWRLRRFLLNGALCQGYGLRVPSPASGGGTGRGQTASEDMKDETARKPTWRVGSTSRLRARRLRRELTPAERIIWYALRAHRLQGVGFRRQTPMGPYIVDSVSHAAKLVIEIDGGQHVEDVHEARDARRDAFLRGKGYRVARFSNHDVLSNREGVFITITAMLDDVSTPSPPSPASGGGSRRAEFKE
jgi:very-short-patch-repair endonuclease